MPRHSSDGDLCPMPIRVGRIRGRATFMIGSVTKLTLYAGPLAATYKDGVEKRERL